MYTRNVEILHDTLKSCEKRFYRYHGQDIRVRPDAPADKWFRAALDNYMDPLTDGTYEAVGPHFQSNPYRLEKDILIRHGMDIIDVPRTFEGIRDYLQQHNIEGIVFWKDGETRCKIKRSDFGFAWPEQFR